MKRLALLLLLAGCAGTPQAAPAKRPNVIIVLSDDQGYGDFSRHGNPVLRTPNLDRLGDESVRLADFHVAPMCTPTRSQLLTGLDCLRNGASSVCAGRSYIRRGIPTMPELFRAAGYRTGHFGKWHLGDSYPNLPHQRGFEESVYHLGWGISSMADPWENDCFDGRYRRNGVLKRYPGYCTDVWFDLSMAWMRERKAKGEPFFLYLPTNAPHGPHWVPGRYKEPYAGKGPAAFFGMIANLDENMGRLDRFLAETGLREDTIVVFFHDNGGTAGVGTWNAGLRGQKTTYYEGGHRAACFIRWPGGGLGPPRDVEGLTQIQDLLPTLAEFCGVRPPAKLDGASLAGLLRRNEALPDRTLVVHYGQRPVANEGAVLWRRWRWVHGKELYDLSTDPGQKTDLAAAHPEVARRLQAHYDSWWAEIARRVDDLEPVSLGADAENPVTLSAADWANVYCDNMKQLRDGIARNGPWNVLAEKDGTYAFALRRWPRESGAALAAGVPEFRAVDGILPPGRALPVSHVRLRIGERLDETRPVAAGDLEARFEARLKAGERLAVQGWLLDSAGKELAGAYFAYVTRRD
jgi:arylsulfatase